MRCLILLSSLGSLLACQPATLPTPKGATQDVYRAVLTYWATCVYEEEAELHTAPPPPGYRFCDHPVRQQLLLANRTSIGGPLNTTGPSPSEEISAILWKAHRVANRTEARFKQPPQVDGVRVVLWPAGQVAFDPVLTLSRPGFTPAGDTALIIATEDYLHASRTQALLAVRDSVGWRITGISWIAF